MPAFNSSAVASYCLDVAQQTGIPANLLALYAANIQEVLTSNMCHHLRVLCEKPAGTEHGPEHAASSPGPGAGLAVALRGAALGTHAQPPSSTCLWQDQGASYNSVIGLAAHTDGGGEAPSSATAVGSSRGAAGGGAGGRQKGKGGKGHRSAGQGAEPTSGTTGAIAAAAGAEGGTTAASEGLYFAAEPPTPATLGPLKQHLRAASGLSLALTAVSAHTHLHSAFAAEGASVRSVFGPQGAIPPAQLAGAFGVAYASRALEVLQGALTSLLADLAAGRLPAGAWDTSVRVKVDKDSVCSSALSLLALAADRGNLGCVAQLLYSAREPVMKVLGRVSSPAAKLLASAREDAMVLFARVAQQLQRCALLAGTQLRGAEGGTGANKRLCATSKILQQQLCSDYSQLVLIEQCETLQRLCSTTHQSVSEAPLQQLVAKVSRLVEGVRTSRVGAVGRGLASHFHCPTYVACSGCWRCWVLLALLPRTGLHLE